MGWGRRRSSWASASSEDNETTTAPLEASLFVPGNNVVTAMVKQASDTSSDLSFDLRHLPARRDRVWGMSKMAFVLVLPLCAAVVSGCGELASIDDPDPTELDATQRARVQLGHDLFFDPGLSGAGDVSCASCHDPQRFGTDGPPAPRGPVARSSAATRPRSSTPRCEAASSGTAAPRRWKNR